MEKAKRGGGPKLGIRKPDESLDLLSPDEKVALRRLLSEMVLLWKEGDLALQSNDGLGEMMYKTKRDFFLVSHCFLATDSDKEKPSSEILDESKICFLRRGTGRPMQKFLEDITTLVHNAVPAGWGFTPKTAFIARKGFENGLNCLGHALTLLSWFRIADLKAFPATTTDHAAVVVFFRKNTYLCDSINNEVVKLKGRLEWHKGQKYGWYRCASEDRRDYRFVVFELADRGILGHILETCGFLKERILEGNALVSGFKKREVKAWHTLCEEYREILLSGDWVVIRNKLFPGIDQYLDDHREEWDIEEVRMESVRYGRYLEEKSSSIIGSSAKWAVQTQKSLGLDGAVSEEEIEKFFSEWMPTMKKHRKKLIHFLEKGTPSLGKKVLPAPVFVFFVHLRMSYFSIGKQEPDVSAYILEEVMKKLVDKRIEGK